MWPKAAAPSRHELLTPLVWAAPPVLAWIVAAPFANRLLSPAWPALIWLLAIVVAPALAGLLRRSPTIGALAVTVFIGTLALNVRNLDGLGAPSGGSYEGARVLPRLIAEQPGQEAARALADPQLGRLLVAARPALEGRARMLTADGRLPFFAPGLIKRGSPSSCAEMRQYDLVAIRIDPVSRSLAGRGRADPRWWIRCSRRIRVIAVERGAYVVLSVDRVEND